MSEPLPQRMLHLSIEIDADDIDELMTVVRHLEFDLAEKKARGEDRFIDITSGGWASSHTMRLRPNHRGVPGDEYRQALEAWRKRRVEGADDES